jgi:hypothetical protein
MDSSSITNEWIVSQVSLSVSSAHYMKDVMIRAQTQRIILGTFLPCFAGFVADCFHKTALNRK